MSVQAKLHGQADVCKFNLKCNKCNQEVNYTDRILHDVHVHGLYDQEIQLYLLGAENQNVILEVFNFVKAKEAGKYLGIQITGLTGY